MTLGKLQIYSTTAALALIASIPIGSIAAEKSQPPSLTPASSGYAPAAEGLQVYYAIYGKGDPIVVMAGGFGDVTSMAQTIDSLRDGWYPEVLEGVEAVSSAQAEPMKQSPMYQQWYAPVAAHPEQFAQLAERMGELMRKDYDWRAEVAKLPMPTLLLFADHDAVSTRHIAEFFALLDGGVRDAGWTGTPKYARARLAIVPGYTHYNFGMGPDIARVIEAYLDQPTSKATQFTP